MIRGDRGDRVRTERALVTDDVAFLRARLHRGDESRGGRGIARIHARDRQADAGTAPHAGPRHHLPTRRDAAADHRRDLGRAEHGADVRGLPRRGGYAGERDPDQGPRESSHAASLRRPPRAITKLAAEAANLQNGQPTGPGSPNIGPFVSARTVYTIESSRFRRPLS